MIQEVVTADFMKARLEDLAAALEKNANRMGLAVVDLDGDKAYIRYVNEKGRKHEAHHMP